MFLKETNNRLRIVDFDSNETVKSLDPGVYNLDIDVHESLFGKTVEMFVEPNNSFKKGKLVNVGIYQTVNSFIDNFFSKEGKEVRHEMGLQNRFGAMFKGLPGTGKTFLAGMVAEKLVKQENAICLLTTNFSQIDFPKLTDTIRKNGDPNQLLVFILDEFEKDYKNCNEKELLGFLDGVNSRDNIVVLTTANAITKLPDTLLDRPGRFGLVIDFGIQNQEVLETLVDGLIPDKYKSILPVKIAVEIIQNIPDLTVDKLKSIVNDCLVNVLKNKDIYEVAKALNSNIVYNKKTLEKDNIISIPVGERIDVDRLQSLIWDIEEGDVKVSKNDTLSLEQFINFMGLKYKINVKKPNKALPQKIKDDAQEVRPISEQSFNVTISEEALEKMTGLSL
ncbi:MAG: AAA family ATPase [Methanogenium sp.]|jgi:SpoVK/Ycf46/Vps4 family AAA+-type ATPase